MRFKTKIETRINFFEVMLKNELRLSLVGLVSIFIATGTIAQQKAVWQIKPTAIKTKWADQVNPNRPLAEYPRPQMVREKNWENLNGLWDYSITPIDAPRPTVFDGKILVPYPLESALSGVKKMLNPNQNLWYKRSLRVNPKKGFKTLLHFGAVDWQATIFINGTEAGTHTGGYTQFSLDITDFVKAGDNELLVKVFDPTDQGIGPHGKQVLHPGNIYYTPSSGIWQTVWLEEVPDIYIKDIKFTPDIDHKRIIAQVDLSSAPTGTVIVATTANGRKTRGKPGEKLVMHIPNPHLWTPDDPYLYTLSIELLDSQSGKLKDKVGSYFGMRKIEIGKDKKGIERIYLNNKYCYNLGTLDQGFWPDGLYTAPSDSALAFDIEVIKAMGFNTIRKHIKVEPARWYYHADRIGILVWQDMVNPNQGLPEGSKREFEKGCFETVSQLYNHPSIVTWVLFNEKWGQYDQERLTNWIKGLDSTRLVNGHSGEYLYVNNELRSPSPNAYVAADMTDVHSYPKPMNSLKERGKIQVLGEFGGIGVPVPGHLWNDLESGWGYDGMVTPMVLKEQYSDMIDSIKQLEADGLSGSIYTQPFDVETEQNGLVTYDRKISKLPISDIRSINERIWKYVPRITFNSLRNIAIADTTKFQSQRALFEFNAGKKDSASVRLLIISLEQESNATNTPVLMKAYLGSITDTFSDVNLKLIDKYLRSTDNPAFDIFIKNIPKVNQVLGPNAAENKLTGIIYVEEIHPLIRNKKMVPNWDSIKQSLTVKYGSLGEEISLRAASVNHLINKRWNDFVASSKIWINKYQVRISPEELNNYAWTIFENVTDPNLLSEALKLSKLSMDKNPHPVSMDTYANLLYKTGNVKEAIQWEKQALSLVAEGDKESYLSTLDKMEKGEKTWK